MPATTAVVSGSQQQQQQHPSQATNSLVSSNGVTANNSSGHHHQSTSTSSSTTTKSSMRPSHVNRGGHHHHLISSTNGHHANSHTNGGTYVNGTSNGGSRNNAHSTSNSSSTSANHGNGNGNSSNHASNNNSTAAKGIIAAAVAASSVSGCGHSGATLGTRTTGVAGSAATSSSSSMSPATASSVVNNSSNHTPQLSGGGGHHRSSTVNLEAPVSPPEKSLHLTYLKEFRVEQCGNFLQHKCNQHKPFSCFNWHFANQRRRRPIRRRDGTFNYSPDTYCSKYDETTGNCPDGEECPNLHRTAGDTERRYHLRYYKTGMCVYETDRNTGFCMKNGAHCAFAHGQHDLRQPIFDSRDSQANADGEAGEGGGNGGSGGGGGQSNGHGGGCGGGGGLYDKDRNAVNEDPRWQDIAFVLANYKTDICKRPPRLCRQGYACPQYHNNKDRRRTPKNFNYRSTPCPSVKQGDEWGDPSNCENEEKCQYCHTRTEQQFHPEIYKSTKCNDIQQSNHCPRGPFCAFAHSESCDEIKAAREFSTDPTTDLPPSLSNANHSGGGGGGGGGHKNLANLNNCNNNTSPVDIARANSLSAYSRPNIVQTIPSSLPDHFDIHKYELATQQQLSLLHQHEQHSGNGGAHGGCSLGPIARPRSFSTSASTHATNSKSGVLPWSLLEKNNLLGNKGNNIPHSNNNSLGSTIFSAASSSTSLYQEHQNQLQHQHQQHQQHQQQQQQHQQSSSSSFTSTLTSSTGTGFFGMSQQSSAEVSGLMESVLSHMEETLSFAEGGGAGGGGAGKMQVMGPAPPNGNNAGGSVLDNPHNSSMGGMADMANSTLGSVNVLRRSSLLNDPSAPINIPGQRMGPQSSMLGGGADPRSASATGFNLSPPMIGSGQLAANSPSSFIGPMVASSSVGSFSRQTSCPPGSSSIGSSQSIFDAFPTAINLGGGGGGPPQNTPVAHSALAQLNMSKQEMAMMVMEVQRYRDENLMQKTQMFNLQNLNQMMQQQFQEAAAREKMAEKARDEAIDMLNSTQKELEMVRNTDSFRRLRPNELSGMSLQQLYQIQQQIQQDLQYVDEAIQRASI